jgi:4-amino-4-deoxychorismate mutase
MEILKPYRARINALDEQIIELLRQRYDVIEEVGHLKAREGIASVLQDRVDEVRERAAAMAAAHGLDEEFIRHLYAQLIEHSCNREEEIIQQTKPSKKAATS